MRRYRLSALASIDVEDILYRSEVTHGTTARLRYAALLAAAMHDVAEKPDRPGVRQRTELGRELYSYHLYFSRRRTKPSPGAVQKPRHFLLFRILDVNTVEIARVLHDAMDTAAHLPPDTGAGG
jgi:toxin ParE1/3/4